MTSVCDTPSHRRGHGHVDHGQGCGQGRRLTGWWGSGRTWSCTGQWVGGHSSSRHRLPPPSSPLLGSPGPCCHLQGHRATKLGVWHIHSPHHTGHTDPVPPLTRQVGQVEGPVRGPALKGRVAGTQLRRTPSSHGQSTKGRATARMEPAPGALGDPSVHHVSPGQGALGCGHLRLH